MSGIGLGIRAKAWIPPGSAESTNPSVTLPVVEGYRFADSTGGATASGTTFATYDNWDSVPEWYVGVGDAVTHDGSGVFTLPSAGNWLVIYSLRMAYNSTETNWEARVVTDPGGTPAEVPGSRDSGYAAGDAAYGYLMGYAAILNASADDDFAVQLRRGTDNSQTGSVANYCHVQIVKLPDDSDLAYGLYSGTSDDGDGQSWITQAFSTTSRETDTGAIEKQAGNEDFLVKATGYYLVGYSYAFEYTGTTIKSQRIGRVLVDSTEFQATRAKTYLKDENNEYCALSCLAIVYAEENDVINFQVQRGDATHDATVTGAASGAFIMQLPRNWSIATYSDETGGQDITQTTPVDLNLMRTEDNNQGSQYTRDSATDVTATGAHVSLILANGFFNRTSTSAAYGPGYLYAEVEGTDLDYGSGAALLRGNVGSYDTWDGGANYAAVVQLAADDTVQFEGDSEDAGATDDDTVAGVVGASFLELGTVTAKVLDPNEIFGDRLYAWFDVVEEDPATGSDASAVNQATGANAIGNATASPGSITVSTASDGDKQWVGDDTNGFVTASFTAITQPYTIFSATYFSSNPSSNSSHGGQANATGHLYNATNGAVILRAGSTFQSSAGSQTSSQWTGVIGTANGASSKIWRSDNSWSEETGDAGTGVMSDLGFMCQSNGSTPMENANMRCFGFVVGTVTAAELALLQAYLDSIC